MAGNVASLFLGEVDAIALTLENIPNFTFKRFGTPTTVFCLMLAHGMKVERFGRLSRLSSPENKDKYDDNEECSKAYIHIVRFYDE